MKVNPSTGEFTIEIEGQESKRVFTRLFEMIVPIGYLEMSDEDPFNHYHQDWIEDLCEYEEDPK